MRELIKRLVYRSRLEKFPWDIHIEPTTKCNLACAHCPRRELVKSGRIKVGDMGFETFKELMNQIESLHPKRLTLVGLGEPFLNPDFLDLVSYAHSCFPNAVLTSNTNGCFLSERIIECGLDWLTVSLYHPRLKSPDLANFLYKKGERKPNVAVQALATPNVDVDGFKTYWLHLLNLNDRVVVRPFNNYAGLVKEERKCVRRYPCLALWQTVFIDLYGDVYPCSLSAVHGKGGGMCFGNTLHDDLPGIYGSALVAEARQRHKVGVFEGTCCLDCDAWSDMPNVFFW